MQHMPIMPLAFIMHICCNMPAAVLSSHIMVHFIPLDIFSIFMVQRGIIIPFMPFIMDGIIPMGICIGIIPMRSAVIIVFIRISLFEYPAPARWDDCRNTVGNGGRRLKKNLPDVNCIMRGKTIANPLNTNTNKNYNITGSSTSEHKSNAIFSVFFRLTDWEFRLN
jgi:hypothetical protein